MTRIAIIAFPLLTVFSAYGADPDLQRLKQSYDTAVAKATAPLKATYERELQKLLQSRTEASRLDSAAEIMVVLQELGTVAQPPSTPPIPSDATSIDRLFIGKSWFTQAGSEYHFNKDGTGFRFQRMDFDEKVTFTWRKLPDGMVEVLQRKQPTAQATPAYFRFVDRKTAFTGGKDSVTSPLKDEKR